MRGIVRACIGVGSSKPLRERADSVEAPSPKDSKVGMSMGSSGERDTLNLVRNERNVLAEEGAWDGYTAGKKHHAHQKASRATTIWAPARK